MSDFKTELTPDGQQRREAILADVLAVSETRVKRRRLVRASLSAVAILIVAIGVGWLIRGAGDGQLAAPELRSRQGLSPQEPVTPPGPEQRSIRVEEISREQLLAQLDEAELSYVVIDGEEIRLVPTHFDPWDMSNSPKKRPD